MSKIIVFSRTSTTEQDIEQQTKALIEEAKHLGYSTENQVIVEYQESAIKLDSDSRIGIKKLKQEIENDISIDCVVCWELTRIARRADVIYNIRDFLLEHKIRWIVLKPSLIEIIDREGKLTQTSSLLLGIFTSFAESEMMIKRERFMRAKNELTKQGKKSSGAVVFGYIKDKDKKCIPHPINSKVVVDLFNHYLEDSCSSVYECYKYACSKYPDFFKLVNYTHDHRKMMALLTKQTFLGNWCYPAIITEDMFRRAQDKMSKAKCNPRYESKCNILGRGKVYCGHCGHMLTGVGGQVKAYNCSYKDGQHNITINVDVIDKLIWDETKVIANINASIDNNNKIIELNNQIESKQVLLENYIKNKEDIEQKLEKLLDLYINNKVSSNIYDSRYADLNQDITKIEKHINVLEAEINALHDVLDKSSKNILEYKPLNFDSISSFEARQELVRKYIDKVIITKIESRLYDIKFTYNSGIIIVQEGHYIYEGKNQNKKIWRINADGTKDNISDIVKEGF